MALLASRTMPLLNRKTDINKKITDCNIPPSWSARNKVSYALLQTVGPKLLAFNQE